MSKKEAERVEKCTAVIQEVNKRKRAIKKRKEREQEDPGRIVNSGRRILALHILAANMWCDDCDVALSLRYLEKEKVFGLTSIFYVRCYQCLDLKKVYSDSPAPPVEGSSRPLFSANLKAALGKSCEF